MAAHGFLVGVAMALAFSGCGVVDLAKSLQDDQKRTEQREEKEAEQQAAWDESDTWQAWQLEEIADRLWTHVHKDRICLVNHLQDDYTPKTFIAAVQEADQRLRRRFVATGLRGSHSHRCHRCPGPTSDRG